MNTRKPRHPPDDGKAAYQYAQYLKANDPTRQDTEYDPQGLGVEPDFPVEVLEQQE